MSVAAERPCDWFFAGEDPMYCGCCNWADYTHDFEPTEADWLKLRVLVLEDALGRIVSNSLTEDTTRGQQHSCAGHRWCPSCIATLALNGGSSGETPAGRSTE